MIRVDVLAVPKGIDRRCPACKKSLTDGFYAVTVNMILDGKKQMHFLAAEKPAECCGQTVKVPFVVRTERQAEDERRRVRTHLRRKQTIDGLEFVNSFPTGVVVPELTSMPV